MLFSTRRRRRRRRRRRDATSLISSTGRYDETIPTLYLAHLQEGRGEHYISIEGSAEAETMVNAMFWCDDRKAATGDRDDDARGLRGGDGRSEDERREEEDHREDERREEEEDYREDERIEEEDHREDERREEEDHREDEIREEEDHREDERREEEDHREDERREEEDHREDERREEEEDYREDERREEEDYREDERREEEGDYREDERREEEDYREDERREEEDHREDERREEEDHSEDERRQEEDHREDDGVVHAAAVDLIYGEDNAVDEYDVPVLPNEIVVHIVRMAIASDIAMLGTINRVSSAFREIATIATNTDGPRLHFSEALSDALSLVDDTPLRIRRLMRVAMPGSGVGLHVRRIFAGNPRWYNAWITLSAESYGWYRIADIFWRRRR